MQKMIDEESKAAEEQDMEFARKLQEEMDNENPKGD
jgi:hypothetical protein